MGGQKTILGPKFVCTANVLLVDSTDFVSVPNPTVVQAWFPLILTTYLTMRNTAKATYFYCSIKEMIMHISQCF